MRERKLWRIVFWTMTIIAALGVRAYAVDGQSAEWRDVSYYDSVRMEAEGIPRGKLFYSHNLWKNPRQDRDTWRWDRTETHKLPDNWEWLDERINKLPADTMVILDIEHLPTTMIWGGKKVGEEKAFVAREFLRRIVATFKQRYPEKKFCLYGVLPEAYGQNIGYKAKQIAESDALNVNLAQVVDAILVVGYVRYDTTPEQVVERITKTIERARKYGKSVGVIVWPRYHDSHVIKELRMTEIPAATMLALFRAVHEHADFAVIWSHPRQRNDVPWSDQEWITGWRAHKLTK